MRSSSVSGRRALDVMRTAAARFALSVVSLSLVLCAPPNKSALLPEPSVTLEGEVALVGDTPLDRTVVLADAGGSVCALASSPFEYELRSLAGHRVRVTGRVTGKTASGPEFLVESYEIAPVGGRAPIAGALVFRGDDLLLVESRSGIEYALDGPLTDALRAFAGFKVWVDGPARPPDKKDAAGGTIVVESYGILAPLAGAIRAPASPTSERP